MDSLPKLTLDSFDEDPIRWSDSMSMFQLIIDDKSPAEMDQRFPDVISAAIISLSALITVRIYILQTT